MLNPCSLRRRGKDQAPFSIAWIITRAALMRLPGPNSVTTAVPSSSSLTPTIIPQIDSIKRAVVPPLPTMCRTAWRATGTASTSAASRPAGESQPHESADSVWGGGEEVWDGEAPALDSNRGTNAAGIASERRSRASTAKVDAPSVTGRVPASAGPGVDSPAARSTTRTVEKRCPPLADRSHHSATSPVRSKGGWSSGAMAHGNGREGPHASFGTSSGVIAVDRLLAPGSAAKTCGDMSASLRGGEGARGCEVECRTSH